MAVTEITFDPRIDLPSGALGVFNVTVRATPTRIRDIGNTTVYPQTVQFQNVTADTPFALQSTDGTWAWLIGVYQRQKILDIRTVFVTGATANWGALVDVDPATLEPVPQFSTVGAQLAAIDARLDTIEAKPGGLTSADLTALRTEILNGAPGQLDTLNELAAALGNDANFAATVTNNIAGKLSKAANLSDLQSAATARTNLGLGTSATQPTSAFDAAGAAVAAAATKSTSLTVAATQTAAYTANPNELIPVDASGAAVTVTLPSAPAITSRVTIKKIDSSTNAVTIARNGSDVFNKTGGSTTLTLSLQNQSTTVQYASGIWYVTGGDLPISSLQSSLAGIYPALNGAGRLAIGGSTLSPATIGAQTFTSATASGVKLDGATDDTAALNSGMASLSALGGGTFFLPAGTSIVTGPLVLPSNVHLRGAGRGQTTLVQTGSYGAAVSAVGTIPTKNSPTSTLATNASRGTSALTLTSTTGINAGAYLLLGSSVILRNDGVTQYAGEMVRVKTVDSSTQVTLYGVVRDSYLTSDAAAVYLMNPATNVGISDLTIRNSNPTGTTTRVVSFEQCVDVTVRDIAIVGADNAAITLLNVVGASVSSVIVRNSTDNGSNGQYGYGIILQCATEAVSITGCHFFKVRHGVTTDGINGACGQPRRVVVSACTATETTLGAFDTHPAARDITFIGCKVSGGQSDGFQIRSSETQIIGCTVSDQAAGKGIYVTGTPTVPVYGVVIDGAIIKHINNQGIQVLNVDTIDIKNVLIDGVTASGIDFSGPVSRLTLSHNTIRNTGSSGGYAHGVLFEAAAVGGGHVMTDNIFGNYTTGDEGSITPGGMRNGINITAGSVTSAFIDNNRGVGLLASLLINDLTGTATQSNNRMLDSVQVAQFPNGIATRVKAGTPLDSDFNITPPDGTSVADSQSQKLWTRVGGVFTAPPSPNETWSPNLLKIGEETMSREVISVSNLTLTSGVLWLSQFTARKSETTTQAKILCGSVAAAATPTLIRVGLYTVDVSNNYTLVASTPNDTSLLAAGSTAYAKAWTTPYAKVAGQRYAIGILVVTAATAPTSVGNANIPTNLFSNTAPAFGHKASGQTDLPNTIGLGSGLSSNNIRFYSEVLP